MAKYSYDTSKKLMNMPSKGYKNYNAAMELMNSVPDGDFNPYDYIDQSYYKNTARGRMAYQEDLARLLYMAQIAQEDRMNDYNSPEEQVTRMREAGLNPDLQGISNEPAANVAGYQGNPMDGTKSNLDIVSDSLGLISSVVSIVGSIMTSGVSMFDPAKAIGLANSAVQLFENAPTGMDIRSFIDESPLSRRTKRKLKGFYDSYGSTSRFDIRSLNDTVSYMKSNSDYHRTALNPLYNPIGWIGTDEEFMAFSKVMTPIIDAENEFMLKELKSKSNKADYDSRVYNDSTGVRDNLFTKSEQNFKNTQYQLYQYLRGPINETLSKLKKLDNKYPWAPYARSAISAFMLSKLGNL